MTTIQLLPREPGVAYIDSHLWLPRSHTSLTQTRSALAYDDPRSGGTIKAWRETEHHIVVPRNYMKTSVLATRPYPVIDCRPRSFSYVNLTSRAVMDAKSIPGETYQAAGAAALLNSIDGILSLRCGAGKTIVTLHAAAQLHVPILVLVDDIGLAEQWIKAIRWVYGLNDADIGRCYDGDMIWRKDITIASLQTIALRLRERTLPPDMLRYFGVVIPDEAHVLGAPYFNTAIAHFHGRRWALTATPRRGDGFDSLLRYTVGTVVYSHLIPELMPRIVFRKLGTRLNMLDPTVAEAVLDKSGQVHTGKLYSHLSTVDSRVNQIVSDVNEALAAGREVLVATHSRKLCERLGPMFPNGGSTHGGVGPRQHMQIVDMCNPVISIMKRGKQGLDKPVLDTLYLVEPFTKENILQQFMGRILRSLREGAIVTAKDPLFVIYEDIHIQEMRNMCTKIKRALRNWPAALGGKIEYVEIKPI